MTKSVKTRIVLIIFSAIVLFGMLPFADGTGAYAESENLGDIEVILGNGDVSLPESIDSTVYMTMSYMADEGVVTRPSWQQGYDLDNDGNTDIAYSDSTEGTLWTKRAERNISGKYELIITDTVKARLESEGKPYCDKIIWDLDPDFTVTFAANNGTEEEVTVNATAQGDYTIEIPECPETFSAPEGLLFRGWHSAASGSGTWYEAGESITVRTNTTIYARWSEPLLSICSYDGTNDVGSKGGQFILSGEFPEEMSYGCNNYTVSMSDSFSVTAYPDNGYRFIGWYAGKYINQDEQGNPTQNAVPYPEQLLSTERTYSFAISGNTVVCPVFEEAPLINYVDIGNVWSSLDPFNDFAFTGEINPDKDGLEGFISIAEEKWTSSEGAVTSSLDEEPVKPVLGETYTYSAAISAKDGNAFDPEDGFRFVYGGNEYTWDEIKNDVTFSDNNKTALISGFIPSQTVEAVDLADANISSIDAVTYSGTAFTPLPSVTATVNGTEFTLINGTDYTLSYQNNINAGTATVTISGEGNCTGSTEQTFKINPKKITPSVKLSASTYVYNGKVRKPTVTVKNGSAKMASSEYSVKYASGCKSVGTYKVIVKLKGNYSGSKTASFKIIPKGTSVSGFSKTTNSFTVRLKRLASKMSKKTITGYQIQYSKKKTFKSGTKTINVAGYNNTLRTISGLKTQTTYYVRVRTYMKVGKTTYRSKWSKTKAVKTAAPPPPVVYVAPVSSVVYWTPGGAVYHLNRNCPTLSRSTTVYSGSIEQSGKPRACKVCG